MQDRDRLFKGGIHSLCKRSFNVIRVLPLLVLSPQVFGRLETLFIPREIGDFYTISLNNEKKIVFANAVWQSQYSYTPPGVNSVVETIIGYKTKWNPKPWMIRKLRLTVSRLPQPRRAADFAMTSFLAVSSKSNRSSEHLKCCHQQFHFPYWKVYHCWVLLPSRYRFPQIHRKSYIVHRILLNSIRRRIRYRY